MKISQTVGLYVSLQALGEQDLYFDIYAQVRAERSYELKKFGSGSQKQQRGADSVSAIWHNKKYRKRRDSLNAIRRAIASDVMLGGEKSNREGQDERRSVGQHGGLVSISKTKCLYLISGAQSSPWQAPWSHFGFDQSRLHAAP